MHGFPYRRLGLVASSRSTGEPVQLAADSGLARPKLRELSIMDWAGCLAIQQGESVRLSDAGRRAEVIRWLLGNRTRLAATFAGPLLPVVRGYDRP